MSQGSDSGGLAEGVILAGRYRIVRKLGEGAMGAVYLAEHIQIGRQDAIKVLRDALASDPEAIARFLRGTRNVSRVRHPNVCAIYDFTETEEGLRFLAMEYVEGPTLKELVDREGRIAPERAIAIAGQTADGLQAAHEAGIVHRDLKPGNIMIVPGPGGREVVKVVDFDIAKGPEGGEEVTRLGFVVGTPEYMSPEQLMGEPLDGRSDLYSLGLVLFRMLTGTLPFRAEGAQDLMVARLTSEPMRLAEALPGASFPEGLELALQRCLRRKAAERQVDAAEFASEIRDAAAALSSPQAVPPTRVVPVSLGSGAMAGGAVEAGEGRPGPAGGRPGGGEATGGDPASGAEGSGWSGAFPWPGGRTGIYAGAGVAGAVVLGALLLFLAPRSEDPAGPGTPASTSAAMGTLSETASGAVAGGAEPGGSGTGPVLEETDGGTAPAGASVEPEIPGSTGPGTPTGSTGPPPAPDPTPSPAPEIRFASPDALDDTLLELTLRLTDLASPPPPGSLGAIRDTLLAGLDQSRDAGQRRSAARLLAFVDHHRGDAAGCRSWSAEVARLGGAVADLENLCPAGNP